MMNKQTKEQISEQMFVFLVVWGILHKIQLERGELEGKRAFEFWPGLKPRAPSQL